ncbi:unnamed protein product [Phytophthora fragariaefolia]|uniref:Unnamed protein product n=1 Tax=Phytophthora fragariaefolia TaxID=1490495 RepID=A0A9W6Y899_9STRA|nr:unnamed protein product [Phytophthora fragariaefolia]
MLQRHSITKVDHKIDHFIVYDFEAILKPPAIHHGDNTIYGNEHIPVSVSITDSSTKHVECFISDGPHELLKKMFCYVIIGTDNIKSVMKIPSYMCITTESFTMLDIINYVHMGTSLDSYLATYLDGCKCEDKIRCTCGIAKGIFQCDYITSFEVLNETKLPPKKAFKSKLRGIIAMQEEYERIKFVWEHYGITNIKDILICYNNLDVVPFMKAIQCQGELFKRFDLDMLRDGVSHPGVSEKIMYQTCYKNLKKQPKLAAQGFGFLEKQKRDLAIHYYEVKIHGGKVCKKIIGYDANALYLWALGNDMPCGRLTTIAAYDGIIDDIVNDKIFGFLECDIRTPDHLKGYFSEMTPIFKIIEIVCTDEMVIDSHMYEYNRTRGKDVQSQHGS